MLHIICWSELIRSVLFRNLLFRTGPITDLLMLSDPKNTYLINVLVFTSDQLRTEPYRVRVYFSNRTVPDQIRTSGPIILGLQHSPQFPQPLVSCTEFYFLLLWRMSNNQLLEHHNTFHLLFRPNQDETESGFHKLDCPSLDKWDVMNQGKSMNEKSI